MKRLMSQRFCPQFTPVYAGTALSGAYAVQPEAACPWGTKKPASITAPERNAIQMESMLRRGKAMSRAPVISGVQKVPQGPARIRVVTKKNTKGAGTVEVMLYAACRGSAALDP